ncbi:hypothetical protein [Saccharothrix longispora]|uniref:hypothetical protein n=1 Tax=Saccharothrix longispora TaxID=33920 RepID=UPI0028FD94F9|nr:hypothetical protein [Saccharothrix longispora]MDU0295010.1 hypothetical protein [Saccharothrix longispora]
MSDERPTPLPGPTPSPAGLAPSTRTPLEPMPPKKVAWVAAGIGTFTLVLVVALWWWGTAGLTGQVLVTARFDALRTGLGVGAGSGGAFALYLAWRRQHAIEVALVQKEHDQAAVDRAFELQRDVAEDSRVRAEQVARDTREDAAARRVTELYAKSVEQLGSDKTAMRLGGLYALERLAQDNPTNDMSFELVPLNRTP